VDFSKSFSRGAKAGEICFLPLEPKKIAFFAEIIKFLPPSPQPEGNIRVIAPARNFQKRMYCLGRAKSYIIFPPERSVGCGLACHFSGTHACV